MESTIHVSRELFPQRSEEAFGDRTLILLLLLYKSSFTVVAV